MSCDKVEQLHILLKRRDIKILEPDDIISQLKAMRDDFITGLGLDDKVQVSLIPLKNQDIKISALDDAISQFKAMRDDFISGKFGLRGLGDKVHVSHILLKHQGSVRAYSWKDPEGHVINNTTRDAAVSQLKAFRDDIISGKSTFSDIASRYSDCDSAKCGGDLRPFTKGLMEKSFAEVAFALKIGEISDVVDTFFGVSIIWRTA